jgi:hypothetical protein
MASWTRALATTLLLVGCTPVGVAGTPLPNGVLGTATGKPVTFKLNVDANAFSNKRQITVSIYDAEQLAIMETSGNCSVSHDVATGQDTTTCPPGVTYRKPEPEIVITDKAELAKGLTLVSKSVTVGERYRVSVSGMATDDCNTASATPEG